MVALGEIELTVGRSPDTGPVRPEALVVLGKIHGVEAADRGKINDRGLAGDRHPFRPAGLQGLGDRQEFGAGVGDEPVLPVNPLPVVFLVPLTALALGDLFPGDPLAVGFIGPRLLILSGGGEGGNPHD